MKVNMILLKSFLIIIFFLIISFKSTMSTYVEFNPTQSLIQRFSHQGIDSVSFCAWEKINKVGIDGDEQREKPLILKFVTFKHRHKRLENYSFQDAWLERFRSINFYDKCGSERICGILSYNNGGASYGNVLEDGQSIVKANVDPLTFYNNSYGSWVYSCNSFFFNSDTTKLNIIEYPVETFPIYYMNNHRHKIKLDLLKYSLSYYINYIPNVYDIRLPRLFINLNLSAVKNSIFNSIFSSSNNWPLVRNENYYGKLTNCMVSMKNQTDYISDENLQYIKLDMDKPFDMKRKNNFLSLLHIESHYSPQVKMVEYILSNINTVKDAVVDFLMQNLKVENGFLWTKNFANIPLSLCIYFDKDPLKQPGANEKKNWCDTDEIKISENEIVQSSQHFLFLVLIPSPSTNLANIFYSEIHHNYFTHFSKKIFYKQAQYRRMMQEQEENLIIFDQKKDNLLNCFWFHMNFLGEDFQNDLILTISNTFMLDNESLIISFTFQKGDNLFGISALPNNWGFVNSPMDSNVISDSVSLSLHKSWNHICMRTSFFINQSGVQLDIYLDDEDKTEKIDSNSFNKKTYYIKGGTLNSNTMRYSTISSDITQYLTISNFLFLKYPADTVEFMPLYLKARYETILPSYSLFHPLVIQHTNHLLQEIFFEEDVSLRFNMLSDVKTMNRAHQIFYNGYPKFSLTNIEKTKENQRLDIYIKFDGEFLLKILQKFPDSSNAMKLEVSLKNEKSIRVIPITFYPTDIRDILIQDELAVYTDVTIQVDCASQDQYIFEYAIKETLTALQNRKTERNIDKQYKYIIQPSYSTLNDATSNSEFSFRNTIYLAFKLPFSLPSGLITIDILTIPEETQIDSLCYAGYLSPTPASSSFDTTCTPMDHSMYLPMQETSTNTKEDFYRFGRRNLMYYGRKDYPQFYPTRIELIHTYSTDTTTTFVDFQDFPYMTFQAYLEKRIICPQRDDLRRTSLLIKNNPNMAMDAIPKIEYLLFTSQDTRNFTTTLLFTNQVDGWIQYEIYYTSTNTACWMLELIVDPLVDFKARFNIAPTLRIYHEQIKFDNYLIKKNQNYLHEFIIASSLIQMKFKQNSEQLQISYSLDEEGSATISSTTLTQNKLSLEESIISNNIISGTFTFYILPDYIWRNFDDEFKYTLTEAIHETSCNLNQNVILYVRTNLRYFSASQLALGNFRITFSLFETEIEIYFNPKCIESNGDAVKITIEEKPQPLSTEQFIRTSIYPNKGFIFTLSNVSGTWGYETISLKQVGYVYNVAGLNNENVIYYNIFPDNKYIQIEYDYQISRDYLLLNKFDQGQVCKSHVYDFQPDSLTNELISRDELIVFQDCFRLVILADLTKLVNGFQVKLILDTNIDAIQEIPFKISFSKDPSFEMRLNKQEYSNLTDKDLTLEMLELSQSTSSAYVYCKYSLYYMNPLQVEIERKVILDNIAAAMLQNPYPITFTDINITTVTNYTALFTCEVSDENNRRTEKNAQLQIKNTHWAPPAPSPEPPIPSPKPPIPTPSPYPPTPSPDPTPITIPNITDYVNNTDILFIHNNPIRDNSQKILDFIINSNKTEILQNISNLITDDSQNFTISQIIQDIILINQLFSITKCEDDDECKKIVKNNQEKVVEKMAEIFNCSTFFQTIFENEKPDEMMILSALALYYSTSNVYTFTNSSMVTIVDIAKCLVEEGSGIINNLTEVLKDDTDLLNVTQSDFLTTLVFLASNLIDVIKVTRSENFKAILPEDNIPENLLNKMNQSLIITDTNLIMKRMIEDNAMLIMNYTQNETINSQSYKANNMEIIRTSLKSITSNEENSTNNNSLRILQTPSNITEMLIRIASRGDDMVIFLPVDHLLEKYSHKNISNVGVIKYFKYPLLRQNNKGLSHGVISLKMFSDSFEQIPVEGLTENIKILIKKPVASFNHCIFYEETNQTWSNNHCNSSDLGDYVLCSCNHLSDFSLSQYNPVAIAEEIIRLLKIVRIMDSFAPFALLRWDNAYVVYLFGCVSLVYMIGLIFTLKYDKNDADDAFLLEVDKQKEESCCSKEDIVENITEVKTITDEEIEKQRKKMIQKFFMSTDPTKTAKILTALGIVAQAPGGKGNNENRESRAESQGNPGKNIILFAFGKPKEKILNDNEEPAGVNEVESTEDKGKRGLSLFTKKARKTTEKAGSGDMKIEMTTISKEKEESSNVNNLVVNDDHLKIGENVFKYSEFFQRMKITTGDKDFKKYLLKAFNIQVHEADQSVTFIDSKDEELNTTTTELTNSNTKESNATIEKNNNTNTSTSANPDDITELTENVKVREWLIRAFTIVKLFFTTEYRLLALIIPQKSIMTKTNFLTLICIRLIAAFSICALFSSCNFKTKESEKPQTDIAVAIIAIFIIEIPFTIFELFLCKTKVLLGTKKESMEKERTKAIIAHIIIYSVFFTFFILCFLNSTWVSLKAEQEGGQCGFMDDFLMSTVLDYFVYEVSILLTKSFIYYFVIRNTEVSFAKRCVIGFVATLPWLFAIGG